MLGNVRFGSKADFDVEDSEVCFTLESGHSPIAL